ncbi:hypothetical protein [Halomonas sp. V046]|uniref:hypothetical protein n=1 Tax=Halomonas sp. V046 TaxID=3459611 RepID=UPI004044D4A6
MAVLRWLGQAALGSGRGQAAMVALPPARQALVVVLGQAYTGPIAHSSTTQAQLKHKTCQVRLP